MASAGREMNAAGATHTGIQLVDSNDDEQQRAGPCDPGMRWCEAQ